MNNNLLKQISKDFGLKSSELSYIVRSAPARYKVYSIPKKNPGTYRTIAQPSYGSESSATVVYRKYFAESKDTLFSYRIHSGLKNI